MNSLLRLARPEDAARCFEIESTAYEGDEAATLGKIQRRIEVYPEGFLILERNGSIAGFINSGCVSSVDLSDENLKDLSSHDPDAGNVVIMSVVLDPECQGQGLSRVLMEDFIARMRKSAKSAIFLMCKSRHVPLYEAFGFTYLKPSASSHGGMEWHEMFQEL